MLEVWAPCGAEAWAHLQFTQQRESRWLGRCGLAAPHSPAHALQGLCEDLRGHAVLVLQDQTLLQGHRHGCAVLGTLAAGESDPVKAATDLRQEKGSEERENQQKGSMFKGQSSPQVWQEHQQ